MEHVIADITDKCNALLYDILKDAQALAKNERDNTKWSVTKNLKLFMVSFVT